MGVENAVNGTSGWTVLIETDEFDFFLCLKGVRKGGIKKVSLPDKQWKYM